MKQIFMPAIFVALFGLAACGSDGPAPHLYCPNVAVLEQASVLNDYLPGRTDVAAQLTSAKVTGVAGSCVLEPKKKLLKVTFQAGFSATNGPANHFATLNLPYFVSISQGDNIISKNAYSIPMSFDGNTSTTSATSKPVTVELSNVPESADIDVLVGFQLTQQQLSGVSGQ
jgi:predicted small lipoprotein YifL